MCSALSFLRSCGGRYESPLGFDMEWRPELENAEQRNSVALIQLCSATTCLLFHMLELAAMPPVLRALLEDPHVVKVCHGFEASDRHRLQSQFGVSPCSFVDTASLARQLGCMRCGLKTLVNDHFYPLYLDKTLATSDWAADWLTPDQIVYAATDAWVTRELYLKLGSLGSPRSCSPVSYNNTVYFPPTFSPSVEYSPVQYGTKYFDRHGSFSSHYSPAVYSPATAVTIDEDVIETEQRSARARASTVGATLPEPVSLPSSKPMISASSPLLADLPTEQFAKKKGHASRNEKSSTEGCEGLPPHIASLPPLSLDGNLKKIDTQSNAAPTADVTTPPLTSTLAQSNAVTCQPFDLALVGAIPPSPRRDSDHDLTSDSSSDRGGDASKDSLTDNSDDRSSSGVAESTPPVIPAKPPPLPTATASRRKGVRNSHENATPSLSSSAVGSRLPKKTVLMTTRKRTGEPDRGVCLLSDHVPGSILGVPFGVSSVSLPPSAASSTPRPDALFPVRNTLDQVPRLPKNVVRVRKMRRDDSSDGDESIELELLSRDDISPVVSSDEGLVLTSVIEVSEPPWLYRVSISAIAVTFTVLLCLATYIS